MENNNEIFKEKSRENFNKTADIYDESHDGKFVAPMYDEIIKRILRANPKTVLDVGCGTGNVLKILAKDENLSLYGLDLSEKMIEIAKKNLKGRAELKLGDSENMPWKSNSFDVIVCNASFHHYPNPKKVLIEMKRILKKDGTLIIGDPTAPVIYRQILNLYCKISNKGDYKLYSKKEIENIMKECGFEPFNFIHINHGSFAVNAKIR
ncbi:ubiquinone/menaquinone biosynthesis C-methylase UbiE [Clostridium acetobutylicum]|uniref:S-adenosylmethionine-dependent methyltransferase n=1 Tax=Clostridium acetobutylicum (strain ATCC 824 / DSM 792 / JCM 1419 / IAM 19013 / LMG 5710 / NBRC 13948 / NRRL B-527 / VKM B-1787 / 2291 / W) TaxID=272562 RepID=Q97DQ3_CLOAB|nr:MULTISPECIES: methyltransferase domain-containing protein [Clostridium]AAK81349.1 S-adenosylmethionine-dependent methyltransferase [Clostridium acetobutylicum ATCC 824]ADZ22460.1 S-adenosylmethionine-dependent methyltransferase [Clostridium acetobutylicum EA 2018]AEI32837.1 S-adenosylmethionine-dependent methyltransferase [Clostridium acetobutylicum DSM 1731]AWV80983.1 class I SAM-dependent methyltransferase [Clostridium acetobutylicum]MBC2395496.1 class I SAM-dependent methyltransferase [C